MVRRSPGHPAHRLTQALLECLAHLARLQAHVTIAKKVVTMRVSVVVSVVVSVSLTKRHRASHSTNIAYLEIQVFLVDLADLLDLAILDRPVHLGFLEHNKLLLIIA